MGCAETYGQCKRDACCLSETHFVALLMLPDYPTKRFNDERSNYSLLMEVLAIDAI